jgi:ATP-binding cassette, subfamily B (MDR/TAP), member 1
VISKGSVADCGKFEELAFFKKHVNR